MPFTLKQPMKSSYCFACQGCCRFKEANSSWRPKLYEGEEKVLNNKKINADLVDEKECLKTKSIDDENFCICLDEKTNKCAIYSGRPLECRLYPFILIRKEGEIFLAVHWACPFIQEEKGKEGFEKYCKELQLFFADEKVKAFICRSAEHIHSGHVLKEEIEILFPICPS